MALYTHQIGRKELENQTAVKILGNKKSPSCITGWEFTAAGILERDLAVVHDIK